MVKGIDQRNWPYPFLIPSIVLLQCSETSFKNQHTCAFDDSMGAYSLASSLSDQSTSHHVNKNVNDNDDSPSFETHRKNIHSCSFLVIQSPQ